MLKAVRGTTAEQRAKARRLVRGQRRLAFFKEKIKDAIEGKSRVEQACYYVQAVAADLDERGRNELALAVAEIADRRNPR
ncbi:hypothetical protein ACWT_5831 [Actinoplanes sp. SE50]|uniref:hypothetical protein n=1 Tax=unclassified Actinoplanes TaxID=2626549 RepID=UPI00023EBC22|nr:MULTISPECIES: hypothetical protein [unclassified Actinoplanes]AEV86849.1 hypothetical protein ACPL_5962 [Actinoplanes sp. SE50/110]ATO85246.1 hypothetical protein ACWT_5831 [Actinoplanes sp. SE50]SLM02656.1 hypothetical protein ACSP50_5938 [Actinoplanes sp. SE50/110]